MKIEKALSLVGLVIALAALAVLVAGKLRYGAEFSLQPPLLVLLLIAVGACLRSLFKKQKPE
ncbi:hypothetical protein [uncultured Alistipes sp.]|jgi:hypothetical protein|uniref:hypothetical protein n=1 Tax=Alistipes sp. TaxID=1872444 RepID=UPI00266BC8DF|nr:hypothetical protein [uncultured Alistipes sp.]